MMQADAWGKKCGSMPETCGMQKCQRHTDYDNA